MGLLLGWSMEHYDDAVKQPLEGPFPARPSYEGRTRNRLHKRKPEPKMRGQSHGPTSSSARESFTTLRNSGSADSGFGGGDAGKSPRRGSVRNAVRRLFGRKRQTIALSPEASDSRLSPTPRHIYHKSEPAGLPVHVELPEPIKSRPDIQLLHPEPHRDGATTPGNQRTGSPYAVQFPKSVMLKPMDLGNSLLPNSSNPIRRRKTLPTVRPTEDDGEDAGETTAENGVANDTGEDDTKIPDFEGVGQAPVRFPRTMSSRRKIKRKSRSIGDMDTAGQAEILPPAKTREEEILHWRKSFQPDVLRASGFTTFNAPVEALPAKATATEPAQNRTDQSNHTNPTRDQDRTQIPDTSSPVAAAILPARQPSQRSANSHYITADELDQHSPVQKPAPTNDLESRIASLEAGLTNFQHSLQRLTVERNRRTIVVGTKPAADRSSGSMRTPSMLADTLINPLEPSSYEYEYIPNLPSSGSPKSSSTRHRRSKTNHSEAKYSERPMPMPTSPKFPTPPRSHPSPSHSRSHSSPISIHSEPQPYTFRSLYQMLSNERSARRKLETQLRDLQNQITDLHARLASLDAPSSRNANRDSSYEGAVNEDNRRSSYLLTGSSARLQQLLHETEISYPPSSASSTGPSRNASEASLQRSSGVISPPPALLSSPVAEVVPMTSRFSRSESELGAAAGDLGSEYGREVDRDGQDEETPYESYRTPREERNGFRFGERAGGINRRVEVAAVDEMF